MHFSDNGRRNRSSWRSRGSSVKCSSFEGRAEHRKKADGLLRKEVDVKVAEHGGSGRRIGMCGALGVLAWRFYAWLKRPRTSEVEPSEAQLIEVRANFIGSNRTYGA